MARTKSATCLHKDGCSMPAVKKDLCRIHSQRGKGWQRKTVTREDGSTFSYIVVEDISTPLLVDAECVTRIVERHAPRSGRCGGCVDPFVGETIYLVEHTTWMHGLVGQPHISSVCNGCASAAQAALARKGIA